MKKFPHALITATSLVAVAHSDVLDVGGPNPDSATISGAVNLAADGDVIRVYPGSYAGFTVSGKSLTIVPSVQGESIMVQNSVTISNLAATQSVALHRIVSTGFFAGVFADQCMGSLRIYDASFQGSSSFFQCADVAAVSTSFSGTTGGTATFPPFNNGAPGLRIVDSRVALYRCSFAGGQGGPGDAGGNCAFPGIGAGGTGGAGLDLQGVGEVFLSLCALQGGSGGNGDSSCGASNGSTGRGLLAAGTTQYEIRRINSAISSQQVNASTTVTNLAGVARRLAGPEILFDDETLQVRVFGSLGEHAGLFFSTGYAHDIRPSGGPLLVQVPMGPNWTSWHYLGRIGGSGHLDASFPMRDLPTLGHANLHVVGVTSSTSEGRHYTNDISPVLLDTAW